MDLISWNAEWVSTNDMIADPLSRWETPKIKSETRGSETPKTKFKRLLEENGFQPDVPVETNPIEVCD